MAHSDTTLAAETADATTRYERHVKPYIARLLRLLAIDRVYTRAEGDLLTDADGREVLDLLGGYGSTLLGHNHPRLVKTLCDAYAAGVPTNVQGSVREPAARLAERLGGLLRSALPSSDGHVVHFSSTGTEAVEAAIKHALMEHGARRRLWTTTIDKMLLECLDQRLGDPSVAPLRALKEAVERQAPILLAVQGSYHGKTAGALSATSNPAFRSMFDRAPVDTLFLDASDTAGCDEVVRSLTIDAGAVGLGKISPIVGIIFEPLQCEGGMFPLPEPFARWMEGVRDAFGVPLIADEIQSGFFRTGRFLCCEHLALQPDYLLLGKSLGGGLSKISATCIAADRYVAEFGWMHSSTFAEDEPSCLVALAAIDEVESLTPSVSERARRFEARMREGVAAIHEEVGRYIADVRGRGFLLGFDFDLAGDAVEIPLFLKTATDAGLGSYLFMSYLLTRHGIRVGVTLSRTTVLRIEPSVYLSDVEVDRTLAALRELCVLIRDRRLLQLTRDIWHDNLPPEALEVRSAPLVRARSNGRHGARRVAFVTHVIDQANAGNMDAALAALSAGERRRFMDTFGDVADPVVYLEQEIESAKGERIQLEVYGIMRTTEFFEQSLKRRDFAALEEVRSAVTLAGRRGCALAGLGQYTSIVSSNGLLVSEYGPSITTGNSLTAGFAFETLRRALRERGRALEECRVGVVGAAGNICNVLAQLIGDHAAAMTLIHRRGDDAARRMELARTRILQGSAIDAAAVRVSDDVGALIDCEAIVLGTSTTDVLITSDILKWGAVILDISVPSNIDPAVFTERPDVAAYHGSLARLPERQALATGWMPLPTGQIYACLAETITLGLSGREGHYSLGALKKGQVVEILELAERVGVEMGGLVGLRGRT